MKSHTVVSLMTKYVKKSDSCWEWNGQLDTGRG